MSGGELVLAVFQVQPGEDVRFLNEGIEQVLFCSFARPAPCQRIVNDRGASSERQGQVGDRDQQRRSDLPVDGRSSKLKLIHRLHGRPTKRSEAIENLGSEGKGTQ